MQLLVNVADMIVNGMRAQTEPIGDLLTVGGDLNLVVTIRTAEAAESRELPDSAEILIGRASFIAQ